MKPAMIPSSAVAAFAIAASLAVLGGCGSPRRSEPIAGPMTLSDTDLLRGRLLFEQHCYKCHLQGEGGMSPALNNKPLPKFLIRYQVRIGGGVMPEFSRQELSDEDLDKIADYVVYLRHHRPARRSDSMSQPS